MYGMKVKEITRAAGLTLLLILLSVTGTNAVAQVMAWGVDGPTSKKMDVRPIFALLHARGITQYRINAYLADGTDGFQVQTYREMIQLAKEYHISLKPILFTPFQEGDRTDHGKYPKGDAAALYASAYNRTYKFVSEFRNDLPDWELGNEVNLQIKDADGKRLFGKGQTAAEFDTPVMNDWAAVLRGMSDAIEKVNTEHGLHLRRALNTTSTMFGFLDFMASRGVKFEIISYHYYAHLGVNPHHFFGHRDEGGFDLFKKLASYKKAVVVNELNCAEIYDSDYENEAGKPKTETGFKNLYTTLKYFAEQTDLKIEALDIYELLDEPAKAPPENRFGLMYDLGRPKVPFFLLTQFAGGKLSADEKKLLMDRGLLP